jgi:hypothetical protein
MRSRVGIIQSGYTATEENCPEAYLDNSIVVSYDKMESEKPVKSKRYQ